MQSIPRHSLCSVALQYSGSILLLDAYFTLTVFYMHSPGQDADQQASSSTVPACMT